MKIIKAGWPLAGIFFVPNPVKNARIGHSFFMLS